MSYLEGDLKHRPDLHAGLKKVASSFAIQMRTGANGLTASLHISKVPSVDNASCTSGCTRQDIKQVLIFYPEREEGRREMLKVAGCKTLTGQQPTLVWRLAPKSPRVATCSVNTLWFRSNSTEPRRGQEVRTSRTEGMKVKKRDDDFHPNFYFLLDSAKARDSPKMDYFQYRGTLPKFPGVV